LKVFLFLLFTIFCYNAFSQVHGTVIISCIINDSIILVADSRSGIGAKNTNCEAFAYIDSLPKIFKIKKFLIAISGAAAIGGRFIHSIVRDFNSSYLIETDFQSTILAFQDYLDKMYPIEKYPESGNLVLLAVGFMIGQPQSIIFNRSDLRAKKSAFQIEGIYTNQENVKKYFPLHNFGPDYLSNVGRVLEASIFDFANKENMIACVGGPVTVVNYVGPNKINWIKNNFDNKKYSNYNQFIHLILKKQIVLTPVIANGIEKAIKYLKTNPYYKP
jgi:hypothetical protein